MIKVWVILFCCLSLTLTQEYLDTISGDESDFVDGSDDDLISFPEESDNDSSKNSDDASFGDLENQTKYAVSNGTFLELDDESENVTEETHDPNLISPLDREGYGRDVPANTSVVLGDTSIDVISDDGEYITLQYDGDDVLLSADVAEDSISGCETSGFGCCPNEPRRPAHGHENEGCCAGSEFGCCPDGTTPAEGPYEEGCDCTETEFGCCPDGLNPAKVRVLLPILF